MRSSSRSSGTPMTDAARDSTAGASRPATDEDEGENEYENEDGDEEDLEEVELVILQVLEQQERLILEAEAVVQDTHLHHQVELEVQVS